MLEEFLQARIPEMVVMRPEATYLVCVDCHGLGLQEEELNTFMHEQASRTPAAPTIESAATCHCCIVSGSELPNADSLMAHLAGPRHTLRRWRVLS